MPELLAKQHFNVGLVVDHEYKEEVHGRSPGLPRDAATARQKDLKFGELAGLRKNVNRTAVLFDDDVMTDGQADVRPPVLWNREPPLTTPRSQVGDTGDAWVRSRI